MSEEALDVIDDVEVPAETEETAPTEEAATEEESPIDLQETDGEDAEADESEETEQSDETPPEVIEIDFGGNKLELEKGSVPEELAEKVQNFSKEIYADYTRKTQEVAESRKAVESRVQNIERMEQLNGEALQAFSYGLQLQRDIQELQQMPVDWQSAPDQARQVSDALLAKRQELEQVHGLVSQREMEFEHAKSEDLTKRIEAGREAMDKKYSEFSTKDAPRMVEYAVSQGMSREDAELWPTNPMLAEMAFKAMRFDEMQTKAAEKPKPKLPNKPVKASTVQGRGNSTNDPARMSDEQFRKYLGLK